MPTRFLSLMINVMLFNCSSAATPLSISSDYETEPCEEENKITPGVSE